MPGVEGNLFMATYPVSDLWGALQGVVGTGVKEEVVDRPEGVRAYTRSGGGDDKPWESVTSSEYFMKGNLAFLPWTVEVNGAIYNGLANEWGKSFKE